MSDEAEIKVGDKVRLMVDDGPALFRACGPAIVLAVDLANPPDNQPSAWIRHVSPDGYYRYRSVEYWHLEPTL